MTSLRGATLFWMTVLLMGVGGVSGAITFVLARSEAAGFLDGQLRQIALNAGEGLPDTAVPAVPHDPEDDFALDIRNAAGERLRASPSGTDLPVDARLGFSVVRFKGEDWRLYASTDGRRTVRVAQRMSVRQEQARSAAIGAAAPILAVTPLAWLVLGWSLGRVLEPLTALARRIGGRGVDGREPIPVAGVPTEVLPLVSEMNALIVRLQHALDQQRRFVSDAAHELRTPLMALQLQVENLATASAVGRSGGPMGELASGVERASRLLEQLLRTVRFDAPASVAVRRPLDVGTLVTECVADHVPIAANKGVDLGIVAREDAGVAGVPGELKILVDNLLDNAVRYTPKGGVVDVAIRRDGERVVVEVADTGPGVAEAALPHLFERFFRAAPPGVEGSGLGLAIVDAIARRHGGVVTIGNRADRPGLRVRIWLPRSASAGSDAESARPVAATAGVIPPVRS